MKKQLVLVPLLTSVFACSHQGTQQAEIESTLPSEVEGVPSFLPEAPTGFEWLKIKATSDEFSSDTLDTKKWRDHITTWRGRPPAEFLTSNVNVDNGSLELKTSTHASPTSQYTMGGAAVSGRFSATYGYFEARIKASKTKMSTTFWLHSDNFDDADAGCTKKHQSELDILEAIGGWPNEIWSNWAHSNTHYKATELIDGRCRKLSSGFHSKGSKYDTGAPLSEDYNTYSMWWVTPNQMHFYFNGELTGTVDLDHEVDKVPFNSEMSLRMVVETYTWQQTLAPEGVEPYPTVSELDDDSINTAYYDHVRTYRLQPSAENKIANPDFESKGKWSLNSHANIVKGHELSYLHDHGLRIQTKGVASQKIKLKAGRYSLSTYAKQLSQDTEASIKLFDNSDDLLGELEPSNSDFNAYLTEFALSSEQEVKLVVSTNKGEGAIFDGLSLIAI
jgi:beta-glucanase (GH16 family)